MVVLFRSAEKTWGGSRVSVLLIGMLVLLLATGCGGGDDAAAEVEGRIQATATTTMVTDLVEQVGGDRVEVTGLMGTGVDPHLYNASQGDVRALQEADAIFYNGLFLEGQMEDILEKVGQQRPTVQVTEDIPEDELLDSVDYEGQADPHVWFDVTLWRTTVDPVVEQLSELQPESVGYFEQRGEEYNRRSSTS